MCNCHKPGQLFGVYLVNTGMDLEEGRCLEQPFSSRPAWLLSITRASPAQRGGSFSSPALLMQQVGFSPSFLLSLRRKWVLGGEAELPPAEVAAVLFTSSSSQAGNLSCQAFSWKQWELWRFNVSQTVVCHINKSFTFQKMIVSITVTAWKTPFIVN